MNLETKVKEVIAGAVAVDGNPDIGDWVEDLRLIVDEQERATRILETAIQRYAKGQVTVIPVGVLNDILDLLMFTDLNELPEENN